jgi:hypothetical protein
MPLQMSQGNPITNTSTPWSYKPYIAMWPLSQEVSEVVPMATSDSSWHHTRLRHALPCTPTAYTTPGDDPGPTGVYIVNASQAMRARTYYQLHLQDSTTSLWQQFQHGCSPHQNSNHRWLEDIYLCKLRNKYTGYLGVTARNLIDHLLDRYGKITPADIAWRW